MKTFAYMRQTLMPANRGSRILVAGALIDSTGNGLFMASATLYFVSVVGLPASRVATTLSIAAVFGLLSPVPLGRVADRHGAVRTYVLLMCLRGAGYALYPLITDLSGYAVLTCVLYAADRACSPLLQVIAAAVAGQQERTRTLASIRAVRNIGLSVGLLGASAVLGFPSRAAFATIFLVNALSFFAIAALVLWSVKAAGDSALTPLKGIGNGGGPQGHAGSGSPPSRAPTPFRDVRFLVFTASNGVLSLYDTALIVLLPVWVIQRTELAHAWSPVLLTVNTTLTVLLQAAVPRFAKDAQGARRLVKCTALTLAAGCALFALAEELPLWASLVAALGAVAAMTLGENLHSVASWELSYLLSPAEARGQYLAMFSMGMTSQKVFGPVLLVSLLLPLGPWAWAVLMALFAVATLGALWSGKPTPSPGADEAATPDPLPSEAR
ncbi:MFS transporter [Streptomyces noursei]|uniref:MFS transporter n=1 Tax=Streptomyces noursei TaxID=1971 RepID=UPI001965ECF3|nr:MFS transporter [Streptomyces noursei]QRX89692.1 MFS transporter [Streptomyces noursei]